MKNKLNIKLLKNLPNSSRIKLFVISEGIFLISILAALTQTDPNSTSVYQKNPNNYIQNNIPIKYVTTAPAIITVPSCK